VKYSKLIKTILLGVALSSASPAAESIVLQNGATVSGTFPVSPAFNSIGDIRMEFRLHNLGNPPDYYGWIFVFGQFYARFYPDAGILNVTDNSYNPDSKSFANLDLTGHSDVLVRFQKDEENQRLTMEAWNVDGSGYIFVSNPRSTFKPVNVSGTQIVFGAPTTTTDLAYLRLYSTVLPLNSPPPSMTSGDLGDWEFEGNLNDKSGHGVNLKGAISYVPTPSQPIKVAFGQYGTQRVWSANHGAILLDGSSTYSSADDPHYTYTWSQISGPATGSFSAPNAITTSFSASLPGDYKIRLTASDGVTNSSMDVDVGAVNTDDKGIVQTGNPSMDTALGPLSMWGTSPWPWYDFTEMADADALYPLVTQPPVFGKTPLSGTVNAINGNSTVTGIGTDFYKDLTDCDPASGSGSAYTCMSNVPYSTLSDIGLRDRYFIPDVNCSGVPTLNINSTMALGVYTAGTNSPASCKAGTIYQISLQGCLTSGGAICNGGVQWTGLTVFTVGATVLDSSYHVHYATVAGTSGSTAPAWNDSGGTTTDGTVTWQDKGIAFYTIQPGYPFIWFWWNAPDGPGTGRIALPISTINSPASLTLYYGGYSGPALSGIQYSSPSAPELEIYWNLTSQPANNLNYYDVVHALYKLYYRTGLTKYLTEARTFADNWYQFATGQGYYYGAPRAMSYLGMIDRAIDGHPSIWKALDQYFSYSTQLGNFQFTTPQSVGYQFDTRETGYLVRYMARMAALDPDPGWHTTACSYLHNVVANVYHPVQDSLGQWEVDGYSENADVPGAKYQGRFGSSPWRDAMSGLALEESYDILANSCGDPATAALALTTVTNEANFTHDYGEGKSSVGPGVGQFANVMYGSMFATNLHASYMVNAGQYTLPLTTGTLSVTQGSPVVAGAGTNFTQIFSAIYHGATPQPGIDAAFIAIPGLYSASCSQVLPVASVTDDTHLTLTASWPCASASGINANGFGWIGTPPAAVDCASYGSIAATCEGPVDPSLTHEVHAMWAWLYWKTGNSKYLTWAQESAGTDYGGSAGGPGSPLPPAGPFAAGFTGNFRDPLPPCGTQPCGGYGVASALGKAFGFSAGAGNANNAMAYMLLGAAGPPLLNRRFTGQVRLSGHTK
jgi:hypothetical protein